MTLKKILLISFIPIFFSSCYSYRIFPKEYREIEARAEKKRAYVLNSELKKEYGILKSSEIFEIVGDSSVELKVKLYPMKKNLVCGQAVLGSMVTLGQIPVYFPDRYFFEFEEIENNKVTNNKYELKIAQRVWFWDVFVFNKNFKEKSGQALLGNYYDKK